MYRTILGINPDESRPGYRHFFLRPRPGGGLTWARGSYDSIRGTIASAWKIDGPRTTFTFTIPGNTSATVFVPAKNQDAVTESGTPASTAEGVRFLRMEDGAAVYQVGSGTYRFVVQEE
jgi:alpha-L-rhamnosidase